MKIKSVAEQMGSERQSTNVPYRDASGLSYLISKGRKRTQQPVVEEQKKIKEGKSNTPQYTLYRGKSNMKGGDSTPETVQNRARK